MSNLTPAATCQSVTHARRSVGILGKGTESFRAVPALCGKKPADGSEMCPRHLAAHQALVTKLNARNAARTTRNGN